MRIITTLLLLFVSFSYSAQLSAIISVPTNVCSGALTQNDILFVGSNGTLPYTFTYTLNGGSYETITTSSINDTVALTNINQTPGVYEYTLVSVEDASLNVQPIGTVYSFTIHPLPIITGVTSICPSETTQLTGDGTASFINAWSSSVYAVAAISGTGIVTGLNAGITTITYTNSYGCSSFINVTVNANPVINLGPNVTACNGQVVQLVAQGVFSTFIWTGPNGFIATSSTINISNLTPGVNIFSLTATSFGGCVGSANVAVTVSSPILNIVNPFQTLCNGSDFLMSVNGTGTNYSWSENGVGTVLSTTSTLSLIPSQGVHNYTVTGYDSNGCYGTADASVNVLATEIIPVLEIDSVQCGYGGLSITNVGDYSFLWGTGSTNSLLENVAVGPYSLSMTDNTVGCTSNFNFDLPISLTPGDCGHISGFVVMDGNENCQINPTDINLSNRLVVANPGNYLTTTDQNGFYSFNLPLGSYIVSEILNNPLINTFCNPNYSVDLVNNGDSISDNNFFDTIAGLLDLQAYIMMSPVVPGFTFQVYPYFSCVTTDGNSLLNGMHAWLTIPPGAVFLGCNAPFSVSNDTIHFTLTSTNNFPPLFFTATNIPLGSMVNMCIGIEPFLGETLIANNISCISTLSIGSFDPNDKTTFINGVQSDSTILLTDEKLDYVVRFQNTGTAPAQNIYVLDTISPNLDLNTFEFIASSHTCHVTLLENRVLKFDFPQIFLADSNANEQESHGFFQYSIRQNVENVLGDVIENTAYIYFDFNEAVVTNTTFDSIVEVDNTNSIGNKEALFKLKLYPNPSKGIFTIESDVIMDQIQVVSTDGLMIDEFTPNSATAKIDLSRLTQGVYFIQINTIKGQELRRIVIQ